MDKSEGKRLLGYLKGQKKPFILSLVAMVVYGATDGFLPFLIKEVLDKIFAEKNEQALFYIPIALIAFALVRGVSGFFQKYLTASVGLEIVKQIRNEISQKLLTLSPGFFANRSTGDIVSSMTNDTLLVRSAITDSASALVRDTVRVIALVSAAIYLDPLLGVIAIFGLPVGIWPVIRFGKRVKKHSKVGQNVLGGVTSKLTEIIAGIRVIQQNNQEENKHSEFKEQNQSFTDTFKQAEKYGALSAPTNEIIACIAISFVIVYGGATVISGVRTQGDFIAFLTAMFLMYEPVKKLGRVNATLQQGLAASSRIFSILDTEPQIKEVKGARVLRQDEVEVEFRNVSFKYYPEQPNVLTNVNLTLPVGSKVALVGESGGGKSTMARLLLREYDVTEGEILLNGYNIKEITLQSLRSSIAYVEQEPFLFNCSIYDNILMAKPEASEKEVHAACDAAYALNFISALPEGFDTMVGERGVKVSGGQRARIAIARAVLKNAPLLVLDEATASLDSESEQAVQLALKNLMQGRTSLVIAHRLSTILDADTIAVIKKGEVVECGTHRELTSRRGEYAQLTNLQRAV